MVFSHSPLKASALLAALVFASVSFPVATAKETNELLSRIVGGLNAPSGAYKFIVSWDHRCGGSLIAPDLVLTAAHCAAIDGPLRIGSDFSDKGGVDRTVATQCTHPNYDDVGASLDYDFLILKLDQPVDIHEYPVIELNDIPTLPEVNDSLTVIGFGTTSYGGSTSDRLQTVDVPAVSFETCSSQYGELKDDIHLCAGFTEGGKDSCQGDSGGPIFEMRAHNGSGPVPVQVGVVSYGHGCADPDHSGVYARVSGAYGWIQSTMANLKAGLGCQLPVPEPVDPVPEPVDHLPTTCTDNPVGWYDAEGPAFDCAWYAFDPEYNCAEYGDKFENMNATANKACCACLTIPPAPELPPAPEPPVDLFPGSCTDNPVGWHDADDFDCEWYATGDPVTNCRVYGKGFENAGAVANSACCACGGGISNLG